MRSQTTILASTTVGLLMASASAFALGATALPGPAAVPERVLMIPAQAKCQEGESAEACAARQQAEQPAPAPEPEAASEPEPEAQPAPEPEPEAAPEPEPEAAPAPKPKQQAEPEPEPQTEQAPAAEEPQEAPAAEEPQKAPTAEKRQEAPAAEEPQETPAAEKQQEPPAADEQQEAPTADEQQEAPAGEERPEAPAAEEQQDAPAAEEPKQAPAAEEQQEPPAAEERQEPPAAEEPQEAPTADEQQEAPAGAEQPEAPAAEQPEAPAAEEPAQAPAGEAPAAPDAAEEQPGAADAAPILDSQKEEPPAAAQPDGGAEQPAAPQQPAEAEAAPPPASDAEAQAQSAAPVEIQSLEAEKGERVERPRARERRDDVEVVREIGSSVVFEINNHIYIDSPDRDRIVRDAEVYYEDLPRGRTREVIVRPNGVRVVTIRNRYGDVIRRSKFIGDREVVLVYVDEDDYDRVREWRDPGLDLPPMRLRIPREEYILEAEAVRDEDVYYEFLELPPVERVERTYSLAEVKRSARIRDKVRRVDLDTINFEFGSASIADSEIDKLDGVASAMQKLLDRNPGETFLIEGHTDAVGSDIANLALSDRRAEAVADALTNVFDIPPENLAPQGYGEQYLKVRTEERERENRRVAIRRITPLVKPVASAQ